MRSVSKSRPSRSLSSFSLSRPIAIAVVLAACLTCLSSVNAYLVGVTFCDDTGCTAGCTTSFVENGVCYDTGTSSAYAVQNCASQNSTSSWTGVLYLFGCGVFTIATPSGANSQTCVAISQANKYAKVDCGAALIVSSTADIVASSTGAELVSSSTGAATAGSATSSTSSISSSGSESSTSSSLLSSTGVETTASSTGVVADVSSTGSFTNSSLDCISRTAIVCEGGGSCDSGNCLVVRGAVDTCQATDAYFNKLQCDTTSNSSTWLVRTYIGDPTCTGTSIMQVAGTGTDCVSALTPLGSSIYIRVFCGLPEGCDSLVSPSSSSTATSATPTASSTATSTIISSTAGNLGDQLSSSGPDSVISAAPFNMAVNIITVTVAAAAMLTTA